MTRYGRQNLDPEAAKIAENAEEQLYSFIGKYVISFQWLEGILDQVYFLSHNLRDKADIDAELATLSFAHKSVAVKELILTSVAFADGRNIEEWPPRIQEFFRRLDNERERRNAIMHSQYLFDYLAIGQPPMRARRQRGNQERYIYEDMSIDNIERILQEIAELCCEANLIHAQCIHLQEK